MDEHQEMIRERATCIIAWVSNYLRDDNLAYDLDFKELDQVMDECIEQLHMVKAEIEEYS